MTSKLVYMKGENWNWIDPYKVQKIVLYFLWSIFFLTWLVGCYPSDETQVQEGRQNLLLRKNYDMGNPITVAVVWDSRWGGFLSGAILAAEEINASGGVSGHAIQLKYLDEMPYLEQERVKRFESEGRHRNGMQITGMMVAKNVLSHPEISAVIGHANSEITLASLITYQKNDILFLGTQSDANLLWITENKYFQLSPPDELLAKSVTQSLKIKNWNQVYFVYEGNRRYEQISALIKNEFSTHGLISTGEMAVMPHMLSISYAASRMTDIAAQLREKQTNAILLIAGPQTAAQVIQGARQFGLLLPFIGVGDLNNQDFIKWVGEDGINTRIVSLRNSGYLYNAFEKRYQKRFPDKRPDVFAAQGYDSIFLYADAVAMGGSVSPFRVSHVLTVKLPFWYGVLGTYSFNQRVNVGLDHHLLRLTRNKDGQAIFVLDDE